MSIYRDPYIYIYIYNIHIYTYIYTYIYYIYLLPKIQKRLHNVPGRPVMSNSGFYT